MPKSKTSPQDKSNERMKAAGYRLIASWLPKADARAVEAIAKRETISAAAVVRRFVRDGLKKQELQTSSE